MIHDLVNDPHNLYTPDPPKKGLPELIDVDEVYLREIMERGVIVGYEVNIFPDSQFPKTQHTFARVGRG